MTDDAKTRQSWLMRLLADPPLKPGYFEGVWSDRIVHASDIRADMAKGESLAELLMFCRRYLADNQKLSGYAGHRALAEEFKPLVLELEDMGRRIGTTDRNSCPWCAKRGWHWAQRAESHGGFRVHCEKCNAAGLLPWVMPETGIHTRPGGSAKDRTLHWMQSRTGSKRVWLWMDEAWWPAEDAPISPQEAARRGWVWMREQEA